MHIHKISITHGSRADCSVCPQTFPPYINIGFTNGENKSHIVGTINFLFVVKSTNDLIALIPDNALWSIAADELQLVDCKSVYYIHPHNFIQSKRFLSISMWAQFTRDIIEGVNCYY